jgi:hypothetical protein
LIYQAAVFELSAYGGDFFDESVCFCKYCLFIFLLRVSHGGGRRGGFGGNVIFVLKVDLLIFFIHLIL